MGPLLRPGRLPRLPDVFPEPARAKRRVPCVGALVHDDDGRLLVVRRGRSIFLCERCRDEDIALERSNEIWDLLLEQGWTERPQWMPADASTPA